MLRRLRLLSPRSTVPTQVRCLVGERLLGKAEGLTASSNLDSERPEEGGVLHFGRIGHGG
jgi:hypothetical protein